MGKCKIVTSNYTHRTENIVTTRCYGKLTVCILKVSSTITNSRKCLIHISMTKNKILHSLIQKQNKKVI